MTYHAGFLLANGALGDDDAQTIRQKLIEKDKVEAIIVLPRELFYTTDISVTLRILNQNKRGGLHHDAVYATAQAKSSLWIYAHGLKTPSRGSRKRKWRSPRSKSLAASPSEII